MVSIKYELLILLGGLTTIIKPEFLAASSITSSKTWCERNQSDRMPRPQHVQFPRSQCYSKGRRWIDIDFSGSYFFLNIILNWMILTILTNMKRKHVHVCNIIDRNTISSKLMSKFKWKRNFLFMLSEIFNYMLAPNWDTLITQEILTKW